MESHDYPLNTWKLQLVQSQAWKRSHKGPLAPTCCHTRSPRCVREIGATERSWRVCRKVWCGGRCQRDASNPEKT